MTDLIKTIDHIRHEQIRPLQQSLKAHIEIAHNDNLHISPSVLKDVAKRINEIEQNIMTLVG
jgi:ADP-dependent phosphofructokinase/glucokinase